MQKALVILFFICGLHSSLAQNTEVLAESYYKKGEFAKALVIYKTLSKQKPYAINYINKLIDVYQQLEDYKNANDLISQQLKKRVSPTLYVELGYNYQLQDSIEKAENSYTKAIAFVDEKPSYIYSIGRSFEEHSLLEQAVAVYTKAKTLTPNRSYSLQLAKIYGDLGDINLMFTSYLEYINEKPNYLNAVKYHLRDFISEDNTSENNKILKKLLFKKLQEKPSAYWYDFLSWLYVQEKAYKKSFIQEKALYKRNPESLDRITELAVTALDDDDTDTALQIFEYILVTSQDHKTLLTAHQYILDIETQNATVKELDAINKKYSALFDTYGKSQLTLGLQLAYGKFLAFHLDSIPEATQFLRHSLKQNYSKFEKAKVKLLLADILVLQEKFNEALIFYSQIQATLKNSTISQEARFKVAKTSYYKGDFEWAESQLKILKSSTSQLIANDALDLKLLISDNKYEDSTQTALKLYAKADLYAFQNKTKKAISLLDTVLENHKGESITDQALFKQAQLFEKQKQYSKAETNYLKIIANYPEDILIDDAYYHLAELYNLQLARPKEAQPLYEKLIFEHEDSIYFVEARKKFRQLRGDAVN